jgi:hypothetical protein
MRVRDCFRARNCRTLVARLTWAHDTRLEELHSLLQLLCVFSNLGSLLFAKAKPNRNRLKADYSNTVGHSANVHFALPHRRLLKGENRNSRQERCNRLQSPEVSASRWLDERYSNGFIRGTNKICGRNSCRLHCSLPQRLDPSRLHLAIVEKARADENETNRPNP